MNDLSPEPKVELGEVMLGGFGIAGVGWGFRIGAADGGRSICGFATQRAAGLAREWLLNFDGGPIAIYPGETFEAFEVGRHAWCFFDHEGTAHGCFASKAEAVSHAQRLKDLFHVTTL